MEIAAVLVVLLIIWIMIKKAGFDDKKWTDAYRDRLLYYVNIPGVNYFDISKEEIINDPRSINAIRKFKDFVFFSDCRLGSVYYPQDTNDSDIYLISSDLTTKIGKYKRYCNDHMFFHKADLINDIKLQFMRNYVTEQKKDISHGEILDDWALSRNYIIERDDNKCVLCGTRFDKSNLHVHHIMYRAHGGNNNPINLVTLCKGCHASLPQHGLVSDNPSGSDHNYYRINLSKIISNIYAHYPTLINGIIYENLVSKNPLLANLQKYNSSITKDMVIKLLV
jgi:5-methylcytosine-specific restriction endonuclease McrA